MIERLEPEELRDLLANGGRVRLIDVREEEEWRICRLPGAELLPLSRFAEWAPDFEPGPGRCVLYCHHGVRSLRAAAALAAQGVEGLADLRGGIEAWRQRVDPSLPAY